MTYKHRLLKNTIVNVHAALLNELHLIVVTAGRGTANKAAGTLAALTGFDYSDCHAVLNEVGGENWYQQWYDNYIESTYEYVDIADVVKCAYIKAIKDT